ncbi:3-dehydroquinate synthase II family protein [Phytohabitans suffuscus]|uniref:3-dehydroquinate synthase II n=1 Tax=Phytohabitans suffuscus TaxID=624315 RepID=A0A6F8YF69_9ACTN|nr:3-dehydroquinate synthase II family protein [Phytohabitans suffuscus]BCB84742.1 3-dehydroquinate synthase II [Phytohabitans suffuscus]
MEAKTSTKQCWLDIRSAGESAAALCQEALHHGFDAIVAAEPADLAPLPPTVTRVLLPAGADLPADFGVADLVVVDPAVHGSPRLLAQRHPERRFGAYVEVTDKESLERACASVRGDECTVLRFRDPTNIPLEIVLAAAAAARHPEAAAGAEASGPGLIITAMDRVADAPVHLGVLEHGPGGLMLAPTAPGQAARLRDVVTSKPEPLKLVTLTVTAITHAGMGERACVDTCTYLEKDEGILVGSRAKGMVLCVSETHPLPYMPTRPFRVNAGAIMSYTLADPEHTRYLSELGAGDPVLAVGADGRTRHVIVGRVKIETRPLLSIDAVSDSGERVNVIVQDDWHVRILGPGAAVLNSTALQPGDRILGYLAQRERHVGYPIDEFCKEQ